MKRFSSYAFWVAFASAIAIFLEDFTNLVGININVSVIESLILSFCGVLVVIGIVKKNDNSIEKTTQIDENSLKEEVSEEFEDSIEEEKGVDKDENI